MKKTLTYLTVIILLASCNRDQQNESDEMQPLYPAPQTVALNTEEGYKFNTVTGDSIQPIKNSWGETIKTGVPVPANGKVIDPDSVAKPKIIPAGKPKVVSTQENVEKIPEVLTVIPVNKDSLKTFTPGVDTSDFVVNIRRCLRRWTLQQLSAILQLWQSFKLNKRLYRFSKKRTQSFSWKTTF